jgi:hypothetical protein
MEEEGKLFTFIRTVRTESSEALTILDGDEHIGVVDLHFADDVAHATLILAKVLDEDAIHELIHAIDEQLVCSVLPPFSRGDFATTVYHGHEIGSFCDPSPGDEYGTENGN